MSKPIATVTVTFEGEEARAILDDLRAGEERMREEIAAALGVPAKMLGLDEGGSMAIRYSALDLIEVRHRPVTVSPPRFPFDPDDIQ